MAVKLSEFAKKLVREREMLRPKLGSAILPLMMIRMSHGYDPFDNPWAPLPRPVMLVTVCRKTGCLFVPRSNDMLYSAGVQVYYSDWWNFSEVVSVRPPQLINGKLLEVSFLINEGTGHEEYGHPNPW